MSHYARIGLDERRAKRLAARAATEQEAREARRREIQELVKQARLKP